ncbi:MAG: cupin domain-containing protein [Syntrophobacteraceae bacterium]
MDQNADYWIEKLKLSKHPEGGWFVRTYSSEERIEGGYLPERFGGPRAFSSAIYYLLKGSEFSALHRLKADEVWHFYAGSSITLYIIEWKGRLSEIRMGNSSKTGETFQCAVKAGCWFGGVVNEPESYALMGCTVAPGFEYEDFELGDREKLIEEYPKHRLIIEKLTR